MHSKQPESTASGQRPYRQRAQLHCAPLHLLMKDLKVPNSFLPLRRVNSRASPPRTGNCFAQIKGKRKVQGVAQSQAAALPKYQEEEETDKTKQAQIEQTYEKHQD